MYTDTATQEAIKNIEDNQTVKKYTGLIFRPSNNIRSWECTSKKKDLLNNPAELWEVNHKKWKSIAYTTDFL